MIKEENIVTKENRNRIYSFDFLKTISIFFVLFAHFGKVNCNLWEKGINQYINYFFKTFAVFAVPMFFMINGALLLKNPEQCTFKKIYRKAFHFLLIRFIYCGLGIMSEIFFLNQSYGRKELMDAFVKSPCDPFTFLWFLDALIGIYVLVPFIAKMMLKDKRTSGILCTLIFLFTMVPYTYDHTLNVIFEQCIGLSYSLKSIVEQFSLFNSYYSYTLFYFLAGIIIYEYKERIMQKAKGWLLLIVATALFAIWYIFCCWQTLTDKVVYESMWNGYSTAFIGISAVILFLLMINSMEPASVVVRAFFEKTGKNTLGIFLLEGFVAVPYYQIITPEPQKICIMAFINVFVIFLLCFFATSIIKRVPIIKKLVL